MVADSPFLRLRSGAARLGRARETTPTALDRMRWRQNARDIFAQSQCLAHNGLEPPSGEAFGTMGFRFYLIPRETFQNWHGSKVITTRRFRPSFPDETPDVPERVDFSSVRRTQHA